MKRFLPMLLLLLALSVASGCDELEDLDITINVPGYDWLYGGDYYYEDTYYEDEYYYYEDESFYYEDDYYYDDVYYDDVWYEDVWW